MKSEFIKAIHDLKSNKAAGIVEIPAELWKNSGEETRNILFKMVEKTYREGLIPKDFTQSRTILIPKKGNPTDCNNYRTISLLTHASKILLNIIKNRIWKKMETNLGEDQFGFRQGMGTREAILALRTIAKRRLI